MYYYAIRDRKGDEMIGVFKFEEALATLPVVSYITKVEFDTYLEFGNQSVVTGVTGLDTGSGQKLVFGSECQTIGNMTQSAADSEIIFGSTGSITIAPIASDS